jgi:hypothetical protein
MKEIEEGKFGYSRGGSLLKRERREQNLGVFGAYLN